MYREVGEWAKDKHYYFRKYLQAFANATKSAYRRYYIDLFAGPGKCRVKDSGEIIEGSPRIALGIMPSFHHYFFVDIDSRYVEGLHLLSSEFPDKATTVVHGDCNQVVGEILDRVEKRSPTFVLLDPTNEAYKWSTIEALAGYQTDLFLNLPFFMSTRRLLTHRGIFSENRLSDFFGPLEWRALYERMRNGESVNMFDFMRLYQDGLRELGYTETTNKAALIKNATGQPLYYLVLASKSPVAKKIFNDILQIEPGGQRHLF